MTPDLARRRALLTAALGFARLDNVGLAGAVGTQLRLPLKVGRGTSSTVAARNW